jgi:hypothetical protein
MEPVPVPVRLRRGFMGGTAGGISTPFGRLAAACRSTIGTLDVVDTNVGSEICHLSTCLFGRLLLVGLRGEMLLYVALDCDTYDMPDSGPSRGGVALAE